MSDLPPEPGKAFQVVTPESREPLPWVMTQAEQAAFQAFSRFFDESRIAERAAAVEAGSDAVAVTRIGMMLGGSGVISNYASLRTQPEDAMVIVPADDLLSGQYAREEAKIIHEYAHLLHGDSLNNDRMTAIATMGTAARIVRNDDNLVRIKEAFGSTEEFNRCLQELQQINERVFPVLEPLTHYLHELGPSPDLTQIYTSSPEKLRELSTILSPITTEDANTYIRFLDRIAAAEIRIHNNYHAYPEGSDGEVRWELLSSPAVQEAARTTEGFAHTYHHHSEFVADHIASQAASEESLTRQVADMRLFWQHVVNTAASYGIPESEARTFFRDCSPDTPNPEDRANAMEATLVARLESESTNIRPDATPSPGNNSPGGQRR